MTPTVEEKLFLSVEIKSYNSRFLDLSITLPSSLSRLENFFREKVTAAVVAVDIHIGGDKLLSCLRHLAGDKTVVDQPIQHILLPGQGRLDGIRRPPDIRGPDGLMGVLGVLSAFIDDLFLRQVFRSVLRSLRWVRHC